MNRDIKFRAWYDGDGKKEMYYPITYSYSDVFGVKQMQWLFPCDDGCHKYIVTPLMQFTGLKDKNGVDIYEGDIIKWKETRFHTEEQKKNGVPMPKIYKSAIVFEEGGFIVSSDKEQDTPLCCFFSESMGNKFDYKAEIIGNIYENPEILNNV